jgi:hypothetical protein
MKTQRIKVARGERVEIFLRREKGTGNADLCMIGPVTVSIIVTKADEKKAAR